MRFVLLLLAAAAGGCGGSGGPAGDEGPGEAAPMRTEGGDILAPEVFAFSGEGLWDGRPSLGGVWVAHPDAATPSRVLIRHGEGGAEVTGALFRREGAAAGPPLQVSSDAAEALGLVAGQPATLDVTALTRPEPIDAETTDAGGEPGDDAMPPQPDAAVPDAAVPDAEVSRRALAAGDGLGRR